MVIFSILSGKNMLVAIKYNKLKFLESFRQILSKGTYFFHSLHIPYQ